MLVYWIVLLLVQWDVIFGKLVFDDWLGDSPSICLPKVGWLSFSLQLVIAGRIILAAILGFVYLQVF